MMGSMPPTSTTSLLVRRVVPQDSARETLAQCPGVRSLYRTVEAVWSLRGIHGFLDDFPICSERSEQSRDDGFFWSESLPAVCEVTHPSRIRVERQSPSVYGTRDLQRDASGRASNVGALRAGIALDAGGSEDVGRRRCSWHRK
jgi:hypothetical protein